MSEHGIFAYDLEPPVSPVDVPEWRPMRDIRSAPPRPRWTPPPLPEGFARVELDNDFYTGPGWTDWNSADADYPSRIFDIPVEQRERWRKAMDDYAAMQEEISVLRSVRLATRGFAPEGWTLRPPYQVQP